MSELLSPQVRTYIYQVCMAVIPIAGLAGLITDQQVPLVIALISAILSTGTAVAHRPTKPAHE